MARNFDFDLIIVGSGAAGSAAAFAAAEAGLNVAVAEVGTWGGCGVNSRDLPFRAVSSFSHLYQNALRGSRFGLSSSNLRFNYPTLLNWQTLAKKRATSGLKKSFEEAGITCLKGLAHFLSPYEISIGSVCFSAPKFLIASGSVLNTGGILGLESVECLTPDSALKIPRPPKTMLVVGGGATGCEMAEYFSTLGTKVCLIELSGRLLPREDEEAGSVLAEYFAENSHIKVLTQSRVVSVIKEESGIKAVFLRGGQEKFIKVESVLLATGSHPALDLGLENTGVKFDRDHIIVDEFLQTSAKHIFAAGDCIGGESSTERAAYEGALAASNLLGRQKNLVNREGFIRLVGTNPQIASVGLTEDECLARHLKFKKTFIPLSAVSASNTEDFRVGFLKLLVNGQKKIIGATVMCPNAELVIEELAIAIRHHFSVIELASTPHISSSWSELVRLAAKDLAK